MPRMPGEKYTQARQAQAREVGRIVYGLLKINGAIVLHGSRSSIWHGLPCHGTLRYYAGMKSTSSSK